MHTAQWDAATQKWGEGYTSNEHMQELLTMMLGTKLHFSCAEPPLRLCYDGLVEISLSAWVWSFDAH